MTTIKGTGKIIDVQCKNRALIEFPELLFGVLLDGTKVFDATHYLQALELDAKLSVEDFFKKFDFQIKAIAEAYNIPVTDMVRINTEGHQLMDGSLCYPFISYTDPQFCAYMNEIIDEMFINGVVVSDTYLIQNAQRRLAPELLKQISAND